MTELLLNPDFSSGFNVRVLRKSNLSEGEIYLEENHVALWKSP